MTPARLPCVVPGCRCTMSAAEATHEGDTVCLCRKHWPMVPKLTRRMIRNLDSRGKPEVARWLWARAARHVKDRSLGI